MHGVELAASQVEKLKKVFGVCLEAKAYVVKF